VRVRFFGVDAPEYDQKMIYNGQELECGACVHGSHVCARVIAWRGMQARSYS